MASDDTLRKLVEELRAAELEHLEKQGPVLNRLHDAILALSVHAGVTSDSDDSDDQP